MQAIAALPERSLNTPDEIAAHLADTFRSMQEATPLKTGDEVSITSRVGISPEVAVGDVGIMLCDLPDQLFSWVLVFTRGGTAVPALIETTKLAKRGPATADGQ